jgi:hypothetical protein
MMINSHSILPAYDPVPYQHSKKREKLYVEILFVNFETSEQMSTEILHQLKRKRKN